MPIDRYAVERVADGYVIHDRRMRAFCSLDGETPLRWHSEAAASFWLARCYRVWDFRPLLWDEPPPVSTWGRPGRRMGTDKSPWTGWVPPQDDSMFG